MPLHVTEIITASLYVLSTSKLAVRLSRGCSNLQTR